MSTKVVIILPREHNDGSRVLLRVFRQVEDSFIDIAGGFNVIRDVYGAYRMDNGTLCVEEPVAIYTIVCDNADKVEALRAIALQACKDFRQECIYFETSEVNVTFVS
jgi:hypothetical protein